jgi:hypothetical protein
MFLHRECIRDILIQGINPADITPQDPEEVHSRLEGIPLQRNMCRFKDFLKIL